MSSSSSTSHYTSFAIAGGTGNIGKSTAASLLAEVKGAHVVVLTRSESSSVVEGAERRVVADYDNVEALAKALQGTQVVINALGQGSLADESSKNLARAAKQAGAELIVPNEWGVDLEAIHKSDTEVHPFLLGKIAFPSFANELGLAYLQFQVGLFASAFGRVTSADPSKKTATIVGPGDSKFSLTSEADIGRFVGASFAKLPKSELQNKRLSVTGRLTTINELLPGYDITHIDPAEGAKQSQDLAGLGPRSFYIWLLLVIHTGQSAFHPPDNDRVGFVPKDTGSPL